MSSFTDAEVRAIQRRLETPELKTFSHNSSPSPDGLKRPNHYLSIHELESDDMRLDSSGGLSYILTTSGELCFQPKEYPKEAAAAGFIYFNAAADITGISNDSDHYHADVASIFLVLWLLKAYSISMTHKIEVVQAKPVKTLDVYPEELSELLAKISPELQKTLNTANKAVAEFEDAVEVEDDWQPPPRSASPSSIGIFSGQERSKTLYNDMLEEYISTNSASKDVMVLS